MIVHIRRALNFFDKRPRLDQTNHKRKERVRIGKNQRSLESNKNIQNIFKSVVITIDVIYTSIIYTIYVYKFIFKCDEAITIKFTQIYKKTVIFTKHYKKYISIILIKILLVNSYLKSFDTCVYTFHYPHYYILIYGTYQLWHIGNFNIVDIYDVYIRPNQAL
jgi:hypothetical protein